MDGYALPIGPFVNPVAMLLPPVEIAAGAALLLPRWRRAGLLIILPLCVVFLLALTQAACRGIVVDCGCFGAEPPSAFGMAKAILRDLAFLALGLFLFRNPLAAEAEADAP